MNQPSTTTVAINRSLIGMIAVTLLSGAGVFWLFTGSQNMWTGACLKVGLVMGAFWLALPVFSRGGNWGQASWSTVVGIVAVVLALTKSRVDFRIIIAMLVGIAIATMILRPKSRSRSD